MSEREDDWQKENSLQEMSGVYELSAYQQEFTQMPQFLQNSSSTLARFP